MNYSEAIQFLFDQLPMFQRSGAVAYKNNLDNTHRLDRWFNHPHKKFKSIHIAGTNGKGSVSHMLASVFQEAGYKTGLYTSPHLKDFRERIRINGEMISEEMVTQFVIKNKQIIEEISPSFFEMTVAMAFQYFAIEKVEMAIIETGMGGRLDSTNIITPQCSVITNIGMDHMQFLGNDIPSIAKEKAGIIKEGVPVVIGRKQTETTAVFCKTAEEKNTTTIYSEDLFEAILKSRETNYLLTDITFQGQKLLSDIKLPLTGHYQLENLRTVAAAIHAMKLNGYSLNSEEIKRGIEKTISNTALMGRWQTLSTSPLTICDTGHNADGISQILQQIVDTPHNHLHMVIGMVNDKDVDGILKMLPKNASYYFTRAEIPRSLPAEQLQEKALKHGLLGNCYDSVQKALNEAKKNASDNDLIFIGGSTFIVAEVV
ncbi:bifunctional folylpolyglutamate synthase/dihydrofolate synthase [Alkalitalea saponilacus]|uniref:Dihydrofolate synthase/folylpolyglutamate synthase n=1 Tax=Alkalitalea saponilacus TaxID=889453 RepID=A0A1T5BJ24_9BACT|nr:folylpolyglutamate synthase/dihydrofolate synthase family protein [Alkalitalea saponilacus]ASB49669.1 dihydrofolate synthase [Alkalitalea saponilacus]SKB47322.1 dihydrofolate synthase / folylpolyglutamate synthase [Alkalitalea saponilacus]